MITLFLLRLIRLARLGSRRRGLMRLCRDLEVFGLPCGRAGQPGSELARAYLLALAGVGTNRIAGSSVITSFVVPS
jgi:hypothetical protein